MGKYYNQLNREVKEYFKILSADFPEWLEDYIDTKEMQRINKISYNCGTNYSKLFDIKFWYSNLDHSVAVALIMWHFTNDKKETIAGLLHDIATPAFKHCIDFMNKDSEKQESTEEKTRDIIENSKEIRDLLVRDNIKLEDVIDYKIYPLADNDTPRLAADRFEYYFSCGLNFKRIWELDEIKRVYENIVIVKNEDGVDELAFKDKNVCEEYIKRISKLWQEWISDKDRTLMQFIADMCKSLNKINHLTVEDLYKLSEEEIIERIKSSKDNYLKKAWQNFNNCTKAYKSDCLVEDKYCINVTTKTKYVNPLVLHNGTPKRIYDISTTARKTIDKFLNMPKGGYYTYFDFDFKPY